MMARPIAEQTSWRFYAAIHGIDTALWRQLGHLSGSDPLPSQTLSNTFWNQCQHGSWYFLPWHRGYLLALEANIRSAVVQLGGPSDWALPYWNYFESGQAALPPEFATPEWPDQGVNPLYVAQRYGPQSDGHVVVPLEDVNLNALSEADFTGVGSGGNPGFGGVDTGFSHSGQVHGDIETQPHDQVHGLVGGSDPSHPDLPGLMSDPDTAALDPIFWLHHGNIDRLWASWVGGAQGHSDPTAPSWLQGPAAVGQRAFSMPMPDGTTWTYVPQQLLDAAALGYAYDDLVPTGAPVAPADQTAHGGALVPSDRNVELLGANQGTVTVQSPATSQVRLDPAMRQKAAARLPAAGADVPASAVSDRVFLNLENVRGQSDASAFRVYVGVPDGEDPAAHPDLLAGTVAPFGMRKASQPDSEHAGQGLTYVLDITKIASQLHAEGLFDADHVPVQIVPLRSLPQEQSVSIGRISVFRQGT